jgi:hypothetical protein|tara:strand:+ start:463 stop:1137 length:675 start_codon:yes stop_codon:yes gene_type:complete
MRNHSKFLTNKKQDALYSNEEMHLGNMIEGQVSISNNKSSSPSLNLKKNNLLYKVYLTPDGNRFVDRKLTTNILEYTNTFIDYRIYKHNFSDNISTTEHFIPWQGTGEQTGMNDATSTLLVPFKMTCHKILFRPESFDTPTANFTFKIKRQDNGDADVDEVASFTYTDTFVDNTTIEIKASDFNNTPVVDVGAKASISIQAAPNPHGSSKDYYITSVWRTEVTI